MKTIYNKILAGIFCLGMLNACDIEEFPYVSVTDDELVSNSASVETITLGNYSYMKERNFHSAVHFAGEFTSDNVLYSGQSTSSNFYIYNYQRIPTCSILTDVWTYSYKLIVNCNKVILTAKEGVSKETDHLIGENYFLRGMFYHLLAITYGKDYHIASASDLAVPLKLSADPDDCPPRATVQKVYEQIIKDLKKAEELMGNSGVEKNACYANVWAAKAMLSRVYLYMHDYANAESYATDVIDHSGKQLLNNTQYRTMNELVPESNPEAILAIRMLKDIDYSKSRSAAMYTIIDGDGWGEVYASQPLLEAFQKYPDDVRSVFIVPQYTEAKDKDGKLIEELYFISENFFYNNDKTPAEDPLHRHYYRFQQVKKTSSGYQIVTDEKKDFFEYDSPNVLERPDGSLYVRARQVYRENGEVVGRAEWKEYTVHIQKQMKKRNDYPQYFINKLAYQEKNALLNSPMLIRLSEMYLNRAEARHFLNNDPGAIEDMNVIKRRAGILDYNENSDGEVLDAILDEARKEFYCEAHRKYDLLRNDKVIDRHYPGCHDRGAESSVVQEIRVTDDCAVQYIPQSEIDAYPIPLVQNP